MQRLEEQTKMLQLATARCNVQSGGFDMLMVTRYSGRCSHYSRRLQQQATLLVATGRGKPIPLRVNLGKTLREDIKRIIRTQLGLGFLGGADKDSSARRLTIGRRR